MINFQEVCKTYENGVRALKNVSFSVADGEFVFIVGPSGSGKSTLVKLLCAELTPTSGSVTVGEFDVGSLPRRHVPYLRREIGVVFQDFRLIADKTVYENVAFVMRVVGVPPRTIRKRVPYVLELVGIDHKADRYPDELSGGEQQRVAVARALVNNPDVILADEPTGNLDPMRSLELMTLLSEINARGTTVIVVTHAHEIVNAFKKRVITLEDGCVVSDRRGGYFGTGRIKHERE
ncbi:MAG: cell division ATP-binding protein FtsE [Clostridia bacterium]|nr:cell division ATP-binding protein FtsE [Clostridia bacterium]